MMHWLCGKRSGKRGRGAEGKVSVLVACENRNEKPGFLAMEAVESVNKKTIQGFAERRIMAALGTYCYRQFKAVPAGYISWY